MAIVLGSVAGGELFERWRGEPWTTGPVLVATVCLWFPIVGRVGAVYHANPMEAGRHRRDGPAAPRHDPSRDADVLRHVDSPVHARAVATLRVALAGAEKLREPIAAAFREKYGLDLHEGYGCTEMAPVVAVNVPDVAEAGQKGTKPGTVGHPLPGVAVKIVDPETGAPRGPGAEGLLLVKGPNRMLGYLNAPERTAEVLRDGWYVTGDIAALDEDGFIRLTDRLSRFSRIAGEMVPHLKVEEVVADIIGVDCVCVVTAVPDESKGERLVVLHTCRELPAEAIWARVSESPLPKRWIPKRDSIYCVEVIPVLGTGKVNLKGIRALAATVGVGIPLAGHPLHRSGRAGLRIRLLLG